MPNPFVQMDLGRGIFQQVTHLAHVISQRLGSLDGRPKTIGRPLQPQYIKGAGGPWT